MRIQTWILCTVLCASQVSALRSFHLGNSLTDQGSGIQEFAEGKGKSLTMDYHSTAGAGLGWYWNDEGYRLSGTWDMLIVQPFKNGTDLGLSAEVKYAGYYYDQALAANPSCSLLVYAQYPNHGAGWDNTWNAPVNDALPGYEQTYMCAAFYEEMARRLTAQYPGKPRVRVVPLGHVMNELKRRMELGQVPGHSSIWSLFEDDVHLNDDGKYVQVCTHYAVMFKDPPHNGPISGLSASWRPRYSVSLAYAQVVWDVVWSVVTQRSDITGVTVTSAAFAPRIAQARDYRLGCQLVHPLWVVPGAGPTYAWQPWNGQASARTADAVLTPAGRMVTSVDRGEWVSCPVLLRRDR